MTYHKLNRVTRVDGKEVKAVVIYRGHHKLDDPVTWRKVGLLDLEPLSTHIATIFKNRRGQYKYSIYTPGYIFPVYGNIELLS